MDGTEKKFVYEDNGVNKVIRGFLISEDDFTYTIKTSTNEKIVLGKRAIVKIYGV
jgi:hypothetical protein